MKTRVCGDRVRVCVCAPHGCEKLCNSIVVSQARRSKIKKEERNKKKKSSRKNKSLLNVCARTTVCRVCVSVPFFRWLSSTTTTTT